MYHSILVPLDGSPFAEHALPLALSIARRGGLPLQVVCVHLSLAPMYAESVAGLDSSYDPQVRERERVYLAGVVQRLAAVSPVRATSALVDGTVPEAILEQASAGGADLMVMSTHGRGPLSRFWLGSVADQLLRRAGLPILLVRPREEAVNMADEPTIQHVLIPLDGSPTAEQILEPAVALGRLLGTNFTLLRVVEPMLAAGYDPISAVPAMFDQRELEQEEAEAKIYLDRVATQLRSQGLQVQTHVVVAPHPAPAIVDEAALQSRSLIALETHGRRGLARLFLGSVADKVVRGTATPVLVARPHAKELRRPK